MCSADNLVLTHRFGPLSFTMSAAIAEAAGIFRRFNAQPLMPRQRHGSSRGSAAGHSGGMRLRRSFRKGRATGKRVRLPTCSIDRAVSLVGGKEAVRRAAAASANHVGPVSARRPQINGLDPSTYDSFLGKI